MVRLAATDDISWLRIFVEKLPYFMDKNLPAPEIRPGTDIRHFAISQHIPGGFGIDLFNRHVSGAFPDAGQCKHVGAMIDLAYS